MISYSFSGQTFQTERVIGDIAGQATGPVLCLIGGIHGNESSGVVAIQQVFAELRAAGTPIAGRLLGLAGNLMALSQHQRFVTHDLNRLWTQAFSRYYYSPADSRDASIAERSEQFELFKLIEPLIERTGATYFIDLHTTSSASVPFIAINDQLANREFAIQFPVPKVLGIEEYLEGPLLSYLNDYGPVALAFEAGQHDDPQSVDTHKSFIYQSLVVSGIIDANSIPRFGSDGPYDVLEKLGRIADGFYEVIYRKPVSPEDEFGMKPGFRNLSAIKKGDLVAHDKDGGILAPFSGQIFMPLYQKSGTDGFFIVRRIPGWALRLSSLLRRFNFEKFLTWLPGVSRSESQVDALVVNKKIARFLATQIFHLLGYRRKQDAGNALIFSRREITEI